MEKNQEIGLIISHVPPGDTCLNGWGTRFRALIDRYQHLVRLAVYGHVHEEMYGVWRSFETNKPVNVNQWTGSVATFSQNNPSFRMFEIDEETMLPVKMHSYVLNLRDPNPEWKWDHEYTQLYGMKDMSPASFDDLSNRMLKDEKLAMSFEKQRHLGAFDVDQCDEDCRKNIYCSTRTSTRFETK